MTFNINRRALFYSILSFLAFLYSQNDLVVQYSKNGFVVLNTFFNSKSAFSEFVVFVLFLCFYNYYLNIKAISFSKLALKIGLVAGIINVLGYNYIRHNSMVYFMSSSFAAIVSLIAVIGFAIIYAIIFETGWRFITQIINNTDNTDINRVWKTVFDDHPLLCPLVVLLVLWFPYLIAFYPGIIHWDALVALKQYFGITPWTTHHPPLGVLLMGYSMDLGKYLGNDNYGCTIYVFIQLILFALTLSYFFVCFKRWKVNYKYRIIVLFVFSLFPLFPMFAMMEVKDTLYYITSLWFVFSLLMALERYNRKIFVVSVVSSFLMCCFRKEGVLVCFMSVIAIFYFGDRLYPEWKKIIASLFMGVVVSIILTTVICSHYNISNGSPREALSIPAQQTARYIKYYKNEIPEEEWMVLNEFFKGKAKNLGNMYNPEKSDFTKGHIIFYPSKKQYSEYLKVYISQFIRHPGCYFSAAFNQMYGYFFIDKLEFYQFGFSLGNITKKDSIYTRKIVVVDNPNTKNMKKVMSSYFRLWKTVPIFSILYHPSFYVWLIIFALTVLSKLNHRQYTFIFAVPLTVLLVCCFSPLNGAFRYSYPIVLTSFLLLPYSAYYSKTTKNENRI